MFARSRRLQSRLTVLYAAMFAFVLAGVCGLTWAAVSAQARATAQTDLAATGGIFDRTWKARSASVHDVAAVLAKDYGFRAALASHDAPTITSAVENLRDRLRLDTAFVVTADGAVISPTAAAPLARPIAEELLRVGEAQGVAFAGRAPWEIVSVPIFAPQLAGWLVFGARLDAANLASFSEISTFPLDAEVVVGGAVGWRSLAGSALALRFPHGAGVAGWLEGRRGREYALLRPLQSADGGARVALLLHYSQAAALAPYRALVLKVLGVGMLGLGLVIAGSWALARSITRPIAALAAAAARLREGHVVHVAGAKGGGEVQTLTDGFNAMVNAVGEREAQVRRSALTDQDTGLPNRRGLEDLIIARCVAQPQVWLVAATFGVDQYGRIRGLFGFDMGVEVMMRLAERLRVAEPEWTIGRTASDTLTAVFGALEVDAAEVRVEGVRRMLEAVTPLGGYLIDVHVTTGVGFGQSGQLLRDAELALDAARSGGLRRARFDDRARALAADSLALMPELRQAILGEGLTLAHQPKWDVRRAGVTSVESLIRWTHPQRGPVGPESFIGLSEATGDIRPLTDWVVARALDEQARLAANGRTIAFSINLSGRLVGDRRYTRELLDTLMKAAGPICMEITETAVISDPAAALQTFAALNEAGIGVSIDDYGSGLSSLAYLKQIAATELKLDRSLVVDVARSARDALLIRSTVDLAHGLGMKVVAEGVEDATTMALLAGLGCDFIQGWHIARPLPIDALETYLDSLDADADRSVGVRAICAGHG